MKLETPTIEHTIKKLEEYADWWKTQPPSTWKSVALGQHGHTKRRLQKILKDSKG